MKLFIPGRICLFGEHSDWAGGYRQQNPDLAVGRTLICGTDQGIYAKVSPHPNALVMNAVTPEGIRHGPVEIPMQPQALLAEARSGSFWSYAAGVAYQVLKRYPVSGLVVDNYRTDLPVAKGLSSSAAICVLVARAFSRLYDLKLNVRDEMELAYQGETTTPSRCGRMDQGCAFGRQPVLMTFDGEQLETQEIYPGSEIHLVVADLQAHKDTRRILEELNRCYPQAQDALARGVQELLGPRNLELVEQAVGALQAGDARRLGELMRQAQALFDHYAAPACPEELAAPVLHRTLTYPALQAHIWGGKGVGSQGDGAVQFIARSAADQQAVVEILARELGLNAFGLTIRARRKVRKALIPAAGLGARLFPASLAVRKEFFPIVSLDGIARPAILLIVEEALQAGLEEVFIVVQPEAEAAFRRFFHTPLPEAHFKRLPSALQATARRIEAIGQRVRLVIQDAPLGFGHAVYCARHELGAEPFLLLLGDHLYRSHGELSCARQLIEAYQEHGANLLGLQRLPTALVRHYGVAGGDWLEERRLLHIQKMGEKPSPATARRTLRIPGLPDGEYLAFFGQYLLNPDIFTHLERLVQTHRPGRGEIQLTQALQSLLAEQDFLGLVVDGECFDLGLPETYLDTVLRFGMSQAGKDQTSSR